MTPRACPVCGTKVKPENLRRHVANVHPGRESSVVLSSNEQRAVRDSARRTHRSLPLKRYAVVASLAVLVVAGLSFALPRPGGGPGADSPMHVHPHLAITINGQPAAIPTNIGVDPSLWRDHGLDHFGMDGMAPLHTHDASGKIHVESSVTRNYTLAEFFRTWGESFDASQVLGHAAGSGHEVWMVVDGSEWPLDSRVVLRDRMTIEIHCGIR